MPLFEYTCADCGRRFEALVRGGTTPECPGCASTNLQKLASTFGTSHSGNGATAPASRPRFT